MTCGETVPAAPGEGLLAPGVVLVTTVGAPVGPTTFGTSAVFAGVFGFPINGLAGGRIRPADFGGVISIVTLGVATTVVGELTGPTVLGGITSLIFGCTTADATKGFDVTTVGVGAVMCTDGTVGLETPTTVFGTSILGAFTTALGTSTLGAFTTGFGISTLGALIADLGIFTIGALTTGRGTFTVGLGTATLTAGLVTVTLGTVTTGLGTLIVAFGRGTVITGRGTTGLGMLMTGFGISTALQIGVQNVDATRMADE